MRTAVALSVLAAASSAFVFPDPGLFRKPELHAQRVVSSTRETFEYISHCMQTAAEYSKETLEEIFGAEERQIEGSGHHPHPPHPPPPHHPHPPPKKPEDPHKPGPGKPGGPGKKPGKKPGDGGGDGGGGGGGGDGGSGGKNPGYPGDGSQPGYPGSPEQPYLPPNSTNSTIWDLISNGKYTTKFYKLASKYENVVRILNSTRTNITVFIPADDNFYFPGSGNDNDKDKKSSSSGDKDNKNGPSSEFIEDTLLYHITWGHHMVSDLVHRHTLMTAYNETWLGSRPQRLRNRVGLFGGVRMNFFSKVMGANIRAKNGVVHVISAPLFPPPPAAKIISLIPERFDRFVKALNQTEFVDYFQDLALNGTTIFAPTNHAFERMGSKANAFLFKSGKKNRRYLKALLQYHVVANNTLYSDAFYQDRHRGGRKKRKGSGSASEVDHQFTIPDGDSDEPRNVRVSLPTLLGRSSVSVDINNLGGWRRLTINGYAPITVSDVISREGVIHVVARVLVPPKKGSSSVESEDGGEISVEELKERLDDYLDEDDEANDDEWDSDL
ncbi:hypothetical protein RB595_005940 [Gaeumannomyces hyphopodioides]